MRLERAVGAEVDTASPRGVRGRHHDDSQNVSVDRYADTQYDADGTVTKITRTVKRTTEIHLSDDDDDDV